MARIWKIVGSHFEHLRTLDPWPYFWRVSLEGFIVGRLLLYAVELIVHFPPSTSFIRYDIPKFLLVALIAGPVAELVLWQWLPVMIARRLGVRFWYQVLISWIIFFVPHFGNGVRNAIGAGLFGGFYTTFTYVRWREKSLWTACYMTYAMHAFGNAIAIAIWWYNSK